MGLVCGMNWDEEKRLEGIYGETRKEKIMLGKGADWR